MPEITFDEVDDSYYIELAKELGALADTLGITYAQASDVLYLRSRCRWTQELENELFELYKNGETPLIYDFGVNEQSKERMKKIVGEVAARYCDYV